MPTPSISTEEITRGVIQALRESDSRGRSDRVSRIGMRVVPLSDPLVAIDRLDVNFRLCLLSGRPATSLNIEPVYSLRGNYSLHFATLPYLAADQEQTVVFEVWKLDAPPSRKSRALRSGWGDLLAQFVWESRVESGINTSPIIINFMDGEDYREQRFRLIFDANTRVLNVIDEYPQSVN